MRTRGFEAQSRGPPREVRATYSALAACPVVDRGLSPSAKTTVRNALSVGARDSLSSEAEPKRTKWRLEGVNLPQAPAIASAKEYVGLAGRRYYSARRNPKLTVLDLAVLKRLFLAVFRDFEGRGYFQETFGYDCIDAGPVPGTAGPDVEAFCLRRLRKLNLWPVDKQLESYSEEDLLDIVELLHDCISKPVEGHYHDYSDCGWHYRTFDSEARRAEFREQVNDLLGDYGDGYELSPQREVIGIGEVGLESLLRAEFPQPHIDSKNVESKVEAAIRKFRRHHSSPDDRREAVRALADVLEFLRPRVQHVITSKDEDDLFNLANNFGIRHHNDKQKTAYEDRIWLSWMFYFYLSTIHAVIRRLKSAVATARKTH